MLTYRGGNPAKDCFYWKKGEWEIVTVEKESGRLPGGAESEYIKAPILLLVLAALLLGGLFVIFLPFVGFAVIFVMIGVKVAKGVGVLISNVAENLAQLPIFAGNPRLAMATISGNSAARPPRRVRQAEVRGCSVGEAESTEDLDTEEEFATETGEDPVANTAEEFAMENAEHENAEHVDRAR